MMGGHWTRDVDAHRRDRRPGRFPGRSVRQGRVRDRHADAQRRRRSAPGRRGVTASRHDPGDARRGLRVLAATARRLVDRAMVDPGRGAGDDRRRLRDALDRWRPARHRDRGRRRGTGRSLPALPLRSPRDRDPAPCSPDAHGAGRPHSRARVRAPRQRRWVPARASLRRGAAGPDQDRVRLVARGGGRPRGARDHRAHAARPHRLGGGGRVQRDVDPLLVRWRSRRGTHA